MTITAQPDIADLDRAVTLDVTPLSGHIGAVVNDIDVRSIDDDTAAAIRRLWLDRKVIFFRGQHLTPTDHIAFASRFGSPTAGHPVIPGIAEHPEVFEIDYIAGRELYKSCGDVSAADRSRSQQIAACRDTPMSPS